MLLISNEEQLLQQREVDTALPGQEPAALQLSHVPPTPNMDRCTDMGDMDRYGSTRRSGFVTGQALIYQEH